MGITARRPRTVSRVIADGQRVYVCQDCGALIAPEDDRVHREWHVKLKEAVLRPGRLP